MALGKSRDGCETLKTCSCVGGDVRILSDHALSFCSIGWRNILFFAAPG